MFQKKIIAIAIVLMMSLVAFAAIPGSSATDIAEEEEPMRCTGYYVGPDATTDGTTIVGQTADLYPNTPGALENVPAEKESRTITFGRGFQYTMPANTYGFSICALNENNKKIYAGSTGINTEGYSFIGCVSSYTNDSALNADPFMEIGLGEDAASYIITACCNNAKDGVKLLCSLLDQYGSHETALYFSVDQNETWMIEVYTGHQYAAVKLPRDKMMVVGNEYILRSLNDYEEKITSKDLQTLPEKYGFAKYCDDGSLDLRKTYAQENKDGCHMRTWIGQRLFAKDAKMEYNINDDYPPFFLTKAKVSLKEVMDLTRNRYEGTQYCPETAGVETRVIGVESMAYANILQVYSNLPKNMCMVRWCCISATEFGVYIPISGVVNDTTEAYRTLEWITQLKEDSAYGKFKSLNAVCGLERNVFKKGVSDYWSKLESYYISIYPQILAKMKDMSIGDATKYATDIALQMEDEVCNDADRLYYQCIVYYAMNDKSSRTVPEFPGYFDVISISKKYGWSNTTSENMITFTHGSKTIVLTMIDKNYGEKWKITADGIDEEFSALYWVEDVSIPMSYFSLFASESPVNVYEKSPESAKDEINYALLVGSVASLMIILVLIGACCIRKHD